MRAVMLNSLLPWAMALQQTTQERQRSMAQPGRQRSQNRAASPHVSPALPLTKPHRPSSNAPRTAPHRTAPHRTAPHLTLMLALASAANMVAATPRRLAIFWPTAASTQQSRMASTAEMRPALIASSNLAGVSG